MSTGEETCLNWPFFMVKTTCAAWPILLKLFALTRQSAYLT